MTFPERQGTVNALTDLLSEQPSPDADLDDLGLLLRRLVAVPLSGTRAAYATDTEGDLLPQSDPAMPFDEAVGVCGEFAVALGEAQNAARNAAHRPERQELFATEKDAAAHIPSSGTLTESETLGPRPAENPSRRLAGLGPVESAGAFGAERSAKGYNRPWLGAHELVRQAAGHAIRRSAGVVGAVGLAPVLDEVIEQRMDVRIHLVWHSHGARLVAFALDGLLSAVPAVSSMTLLQASFSRYAFARRMPQQTSGRGALWGGHERVIGPIVCCYSHHGLELGVMYPLATRMVGDSASLIGADRKWGALGYNGAQAVDGSCSLALQQALDEGLPDAPCVNVDVSEVVRNGDPPAGAHNDICHSELARLISLAGRMGEP